MVLIRLNLFLVFVLFVVGISLPSCGGGGGGENPGIGDDGGGNDGGDDDGGGDGDPAGSIDGVLGNKPSALQHPQLFSSGSVWNTPIQANPEIDTNSAVMVSGLPDIYKDNDFVISPRRWTIPVYFADANTPRYDVRLLNDWEIADWLLNVPIPDHAEPDPESGDGHFAVIDMSTRCEYDFWMGKKVDGQWQASWANAISIDGDGIWDRGMSARGSGFALTAGMIWPDELAAGEIGHALAFIYQNNRSGGPVWPATESDGRNSGPKTIPEGALLQLDPNLDLSSLGLTSYEMTVAKCLQKYGMYGCDNGGGLSFQAVSWISVAGDPYTGLLPDETYASLENIPLDSFRVLKMGSQMPDLVLGVDNEGCATFGGIYEE